MNARAATVSVDGSEASREAVRWAAEEAGRRGARLLLLHASGDAVPRDSRFGDWIDQVERTQAVGSVTLAAADSGGQR